MGAPTIRILFCLATPLFVRAQAPDVGNIAPDLIDSVRSGSAFSDDRIFGIIPNYQTVSDPATPYVPLRVGDKWRLFVKESVDPYTFASAAGGALLSQWRNDDPKYGYGWRAYMQRFGAAQADITGQNFFQDAVLASWFHEDPRYFRKGRASPVIHRIAYAMSRVVVTRRDSGKRAFNFSGVVGMGLGIGLSNAYYPPKSVNGEELGERVATSLIASALGNLLPEFWPDFKARLPHYRH